MLETRLAAITGANPTAQLIMTAPDAGSITALSVVSAFDAASRFKRSSSAGAYIGLTPRRYESGETGRNGRISKQGDKMARKHPNEAATTVLTRGLLKIRGMKLANVPGAKWRVLRSPDNLLWFVLHDSGVVTGALFVAPTPVAVMCDYLATLPGTDCPNALTARPPANAPNPGPVLCACFGIGINTIIDAVQTKGARSLEAIGEVLVAGTNCGSCRPEIAALLQRLAPKEAAK